MIYYAPRIGCCPLALSAAKRANAYLLRKRMTYIKTVERYLQALFDVDESGKVTGILCLFDDDNHGLYISIAWVDSAYRKKGVFKRLMDAAVVHGKSCKAKYLNTEVRSRNVRMLDVMSRHWETSYVFFSKKLN